MHHEQQQPIYNEGLFISDHFFTAIYPGITPTCESQAQIHLRKCRFLVLTLEAFLFQGDSISLCNPASLQDHLSFSH